MSKSKHNTIMLSATEDETAALIKKAKTDADKYITYDPTHRPEVSNLLNLIALASGEPPDHIAESIGGGGGEKLKRVLTETLNEYLQPLRIRRKLLESNMDYVRSVLKAGIAQARAVGEQTLLEVRHSMNMEF
jgi:tryptophanyl-tRNA synthetase